MRAHFLAGLFSIKSRLENHDGCQVGMHAFRPLVACQQKIGGDRIVNLRAQKPVEVSDDYKSQVPFACMRPIVGFKETGARRAVTTCLDTFLHHAKL